MKRIKTLVKTPKERRAAKGISEDASKLLKRVHWNEGYDVIITQVLRNYAKDVLEKFPSKDSLMEEVTKNYSDRFRIVSPTGNGDKLFRSVANKSKEIAGEAIYFEVLDKNGNAIPCHVGTKVLVENGKAIRVDDIYSTCTSAEKCIWSKTQSNTWRLKAGSEYIHFYSLQTAIGKETLTKDILCYFEKLPEEERKEIIGDTLSKWRSLSYIARSNSLTDDIMIFTGEKIEGAGEITEEMFLKLYKAKKIFDKTAYREDTGRRTYLYSGQILPYDHHDMLFFAKCLESMAREAKFIDDDERYYKENATAYATAFVEKKQINKETRERMEKTIFHEYFDEVEFDNETDLVKLTQIEKEFSYLKNKFILPSFGHKDMEKKCDFRVRKLGKHRANGIYFINQVCLCIDPKGASSFVHEFLHFVDYNYNGDGVSLHEDRIFMKEVYRPYMAELDKQKDELTASRYNYLSSASEVFARMGEIYFASLPIVTSLAKTKEEMTGPEYPHGLLDIAKKYFEKIITIDGSVEYEDQNMMDELSKSSKEPPKRRKKEPSAADTSPAPKPNNNMLEELFDFAQLSLFNL